MKREQNVIRKLLLFIQLHLIESSVNLVVFFFFLSNPDIEGVGVCSTAFIGDALHLF